MSRAGFVLVQHRSTTLDEERQRLRAMLDRATPPVECGPRMPVAPARGPMLRFTPREVVQTENGNFVSRRSGYHGWDAARVADVFDMMLDAARKAQAAREKRAEARGDDAPDFCPPFTPGQVQIARDYAALVERVSVAGLSCSSLEVLRQKAGTGGDRELAIFIDFQRLRAMQHRIGDGLVKEVRRIRPEGRGRVAIRVRALVDMVCLGQKSLAEVLVAHGWQADGRGIAALRAGLCAALDRMQGYR